MTADSRDERCAAAIGRLPVLCESANLRLLAALAYFERAIRLLAAGHGPTKFAGEAIVNLSKSLEMLFFATNHEMPLKPDCGSLATRNL
jgi:hypothetical protein